MAEETEKKEKDAKDRIIEALDKVESEKREAIQKLGGIKVTCACGKCEIPIYFTKEEIKRIVKSA